jgi:hypothetical protein
MTTELRQPIKGKKLVNGIWVNCDYFQLACPGCGKDMIIKKARQGHYCQCPTCHVRVFLNDLEAIGIRED